MICVSFREPDPAALRRGLDGLRADLAEIRLDGARYSAAEIDDLFSRPLPLVATYRPAAGVPDAERWDALARAVRAGARYVDIELEAPPRPRAALIEAARAAGVRVIVSHHDDSGTPPRDRLEEIVSACFAAGADIAKVACRVKARSDCARLLSLYEIPRPIIALGMGPLGAITRVAAPLLGAPFTYAAPVGGRPTAEGQLDADALRDLLGILSRG